MSISNNISREKRSLWLSISAPFHSFLPWKCVNTPNYNQLQSNDDNNNNGVWTISFLAKFDISTCITFRIEK